MTGLVTRILDSSFIDGPGHRAVVFLQGCDLRCLYCHNPETQVPCIDCGECVEVCPEGALALVAGKVVWNEAACVACDACLAACPHRSTPKARFLTVGDLVSRIEPLVPFIDGVTFSGGECSLQDAFLEEAAFALRALDPRLTVYADTNGETEAATFDRLLRVLDGFIIDVKAFDEALHLALTGKDRALVLRNLEKAAAAGKLVETRTVFIEGWNDDEAAVLAMAAWLAERGGTSPWRLIPYRPQGVRGAFSSMPPFSRKRFDHLVEVARGVLGERIVTPLL